MPRIFIHVLSMLGGGLLATRAFASESAWDPLSLDHHVGETSVVSWIPAAAPIPVLFQAGSIITGVGTRALGGPAWRNLGPAYQVGFDWTPGPHAWLLRPVIGYRHARGTGEYNGEGTYGLNLAQLGTVTESSQRGTLTAEIDECAVGFGHAWSWGPLQAALGGGGCWVRAQVQDQPSFTLLRRLGQAPNSASYDADNGYGWWGSASASVRIGATLVGIEGRYTDAPVTVFGDTLQTGGWQVGGRIGWMW